MTFLWQQDFILDRHSVSEREIREGEILCVERFCSTLQFTSATAVIHRCLPLGLAALTSFLHRFDSEYFVPDGSSRHR